MALHNDLNCHHLTDLDIAVANGIIEKPKIWDPLLEILWERGARHEQGYVEHLRKSGHECTFIDGVDVDQAAVSQTIDAMRAGSDPSEGMIMLPTIGTLRAASIGHWQETRAVTVTPTLRSIVISAVGGCDAMQSDGMTIICAWSQA